jgi:hypothetical protein
MTLATAVALLALASPAAPAPGPLADLEAAVAHLHATTPVRARVEHRFALTMGDDAVRPDGVVEALAAAGPDGLQVSWAPDVLAEADREEQRRAAEPDAPTPVRDALIDLRPLGLARALDAAPDLLRTLRQAELLEVRTEEREGLTCQVLVLKVAPTLGARDRRYVKTLSGTARLWLGPDGLPVAAEQHALARGRAFIVITFEVEQKESFRFARVGDRLVVTRHETELRSEGAGDKSRRRSVTSLALLP